MRRAVSRFSSLTTLIGVALSMAWVAHTAWRYGDRATGTRARHGRGRDPEGRQRRRRGRSPGRGRAARAADDLPPVRRAARGRGALQGRALRHQRAGDAEADPGRRWCAAPRTSWSRSTIPEGKNLLEIAAHPRGGRRRAKRTELVAQAMDPAFVTQLGLPGSSLEGYLFPDTYRLRPHTPAARALIPLVRRHRQVFEELRATHAKGVAELKEKLRLRRPRDRDPGVDRREGDRAARGAPAHRAGVHQPAHGCRRSSRKLLQTDPTIVYGCTVRAAAVGRLPALGRAASAASSSRTSDNPYNTYTHEGLPPGPIATRAARRWRR